MKMRVLILLALAVCSYAADIKEADNSAHAAEKRQTQEGTPTHLLYRPANKVTSLPVDNKKDQVAPVEEPQEYDKGQGDGTSTQPSTEETTSDRQPSETTDNTNTEETTTVQPKHTHEALTQKQVNVVVAKDQPQLHDAGPITIEHRALSVEDRQKEILPPPRDGKSYTPEEFTSLVVSGYAVTPIPDFGDLGVTSGLFNAISPIPQTPFLYDQNLAINTLSPHVLPLRAPSPRHLGTLPSPSNGKFYSPEEYNELTAAGFPVAAVPVNLPNYGVSSRSEAEEYRPGQVFSVNAQELLELQPERKAPLASSQLLQQLYVNPQQEHKQNLQQIYYLEPQTGRQVPPSHAVIARPHFSFNGGEASVGAALSVSDTGASSTDSFDQELLALLGQTQLRHESQTYSPAPQPTSTVRSVAPQYQQVSGYVSKPNKKTSKLRSKVHVSFPQTTEAPQQYLIETTNVHQQQQQRPQQQQYHSSSQPQRLPQALRYVPIPAAQQQQQQEYAYESPEPQGLKIVPAPKLQNLRPQLNFRVAPQYQQQEAQPKHYRLVEVPQQQAQPIRQELRLPSSNGERAVTYLKRFPEQEKQRSVKIYDPIPENVPQQTAQQSYGEQFLLRPLYRANEQQRRYEPQVKNDRVIDTSKTPHSAIYVSKNLPVPRNLRPQFVRREQEHVEQVNIEQHGRNLDQQRSLLPPPKNNKAYTPEEFAALVAAGFSVTPVPVSAANLEGAQSRISEETVTPQPQRRQTPRRRNQYLPVRDDAP